MPCFVVSYAVPCRKNSLENQASLPKCDFRPRLPRCSPRVASEPPYRRSWFSVSSSCLKSDGTEISGKAETTDTIYARHKDTRWCEIPFGSLDEELASIEEYANEEELSETDAWARFLRGAAYEHWGQPTLALAQYELLEFVKGMRIIPDLWMRKAYNSFKLGEVVAADRSHDVAHLIRGEAVGNQMHFSYWFEENFRQHMPKHNGPVFSLQRGICKYCTGKPNVSRNSIATDLVTTAQDSSDARHSFLWYLASCAKSQFTDQVNGESLAAFDLKLGEKILYYARPEDEAGSLLLSLFTGQCSAADVEEKWTSASPPPSMMDALYMALYYDSYQKDGDSRDRWLDLASNHSPPELPSSVEDFLYWTARNRLTIPPSASRDYPPAIVPV